MPFERMKNEVIFNLQQIRVVSNLELSTNMSAKISNCKQKMSV